MPILLMQLRFSEISVLRTEAGGAGQPRDPGPKPLLP
jgi:hypothetical protein